MDIVEKTYNLVFQNREELSEKDKKILYDYNVLKDKIENDYENFRKEKEEWIKQN